MLATLSTRLDQIQTALSDLLNWAKEQQSQQGDDSDWWKNQRLPSSALNASASVKSFSAGRFSGTRRS
jgi:hypothetical protein